MFISVKIRPKTYYVHDLADSKVSLIESKLKLDSSDRQGKYLPIKPPGGERVRHHHEI